MRKNTLQIKKNLGWAAKITGNIKKKDNIKMTVSLESLKGGQM